MGHLDVLITSPGVAGKVALLPAPHCSTGSLLGHFTFSPDPCHSGKRSQATRRPHGSWRLTPACRAQIEVSLRSGTGPGHGQVCGPQDGTDVHPSSLSSTAALGPRRLWSWPAQPGAPRGLGHLLREGGVPRRGGGGGLPVAPTGRRASWGGGGGGRLRLLDGRPAGVSLCERSLIREQG